MKTFFSLLFFLCIIQNYFAQEVQIMDVVTKQPVPDVAVYNVDKTTSALSDFDGMVSLDDFSENETILIQHTSYKRMKTTKKEVQRHQNRIYLNPTTSSLEEVVLSVSKFEDQKRDVPQQVVQLSAEEAQFQEPQTTADILSNSGKVFVQKSQLGGGSPMIRGFSTNRLLMTVDGVRMNTAIFRSGNIQNILSIDPFVVENTEVILGPGSVIYGSDAVGGVMNFYTLQPKFSFQEGMAVSGNATMRYATANQEKTGHVDFNIGLKEWAFLSSITYNDFEDLRMGKHGPDHYLRNTYVTTENGQDMVQPNSNPLVQKPTGYEQLSLAQKIRYMPNEVWDFRANLLFSTTSDFPRYDRLTRTRNDSLRSADWYYGPQVWFSGNLQAEKKGEGKFYDKAKALVSYQHFEESRNNRDFNASSLFQNEEKVDAYASHIDFVKNWKKKKISYGLEYVYNKVHSNGKVSDIFSGEEQAAPSRYPDGSTWQSMAAYTSLQWKWAPDFSFSSGLRYNHILIDASFQDSYYDLPFEKAIINTGNLTGSVGLNWQANAALEWRVQFATAFRAPNIDDIGKVFDSEPGAVVVPNPDLKAEYAYTGEIGLALQLSEKVYLDVATYYTKLDNALVRQNFTLNGETEIDYQGELSTVQAIQNAADARVYGFEAALHVQFSKALQWRSTYTVSSGYESLADGEQVPLRHAPPQFGNTQLRWKKNRFQAAIITTYSGGFSPEELAPSEANKPEIYPENRNGKLYAPSWYTVQFNTQYKLTENWQLSLALENITNQRYRTYSSGISAAGRNLIAAVKYRF